MQKVESQVNNLSSLMQRGLKRPQRIQRIVKKSHWKSKKEQKVVRIRIPKKRWLTWDVT